VGRWGLNPLKNIANLYCFNADHLNITGDGDFKSGAEIAKLNKYY